MSEDGVGIQIAAAPVDGEANTELVKYLSKLLGLRKSDVFLEKVNVYSKSIDFYHQWLSINQWKMSRII